MLARLVQGGSAPHLARLELVNNQIGDDGAKHLFGALSTAGVAPKRLLALSYNHVGDKAMPALAAALVVHPSLETLHLQRNRISDGLVDVASALLRHRKSGACGTAHARRAPQHAHRSLLLRDGFASARRQVHQLAVAPVPRPLGQPRVARRPAGCRRRMP